jgi:hypothetical protein
MVASKSSDIPEWASKYCPCKGCGMAREEGRQEVGMRIREVTDIWLESDSNIIKHCANEILKALERK